MDSRLRSLSEKLRISKLDGFLVSNKANVSYLSRFKDSESYLLVSPEKSFFITDFRYVQEARGFVKGFRIIKYRDLFKDIALICHKLKVRRLGFESKDLCLAEYSRIKERLGSKTRLIDTFNIVESLRQFKDNEELGFLREAIVIAGRTFKFLKGYLKPGLSELQVTGEIERFIRYQGALQSAFSVIVASGVNSSFPHATASSHKIRRSEPILIDLGVSVNGYKSDLTRVFFLDNIPFIQRSIYQIVMAAQAKAFEIIKPGVQINKIHQAAARHIAGAGYGSCFGHSLGHGIGLEVHEEPSVSPRNKLSISQNMVFTVEPGIYLPGKFGIRLEDMVLVTREGVEVLSGAIDKSV